MDFDAFIHAVTRGAELAAVLVLVGGAIIATGYFLFGRMRRGPFEQAYHGYRADLGRAILLGLELLVLADIVGTVAIEPSFRSLGVLAIIVVIRTFLSFTLEVEISGRWPWQQQPRTDA